MGEAKRRKLMGDYPAPTEKVKTKSPTESVAGPSLSWSIVGDLSAHPKSELVLKALEELRDDLGAQDGGGKRMRVSLESAPRKPVLVVESFGLPTFLEVVGLFQDLDLTDRLEDAAGAENGIDAAFS